MSMSLNIDVASVLYLYICIVRSFTQSRSQEVLIMVDRCLCTGWRPLGHVCLDLEKLSGIVVV